MIRRWLRIVGMAAGILVCVPIHWAWRLVGAPSPWPRRFLFWIGWVSGLRVKVEGSYKRSHTLFVSNHASWLDIMAIGGTAGAAFVAKAELGEIGFIRWIAAFNDTIYIERQDRRAMPGHASAMRDALLSGRAVALFPEATTNAQGGVLPFRASLFASVFPPIGGVVVQPIALDYGDAIDEIAWGDETGGVNARRILSRPGTIPLTLRYLEPIVPGGPVDRKALARLSRDEIVEALDASGAPPARLYGAG